tara:strand:- start:763 stop:1101 length:339 start_codon:yes stop_codon:yes gene_type:complete
MTIEIVVQRIETLEKQMAELLADKKKTQKKEKKAKKMSKEDDESPKKKKKSGYILFTVDVNVRDTAKQKLSKESDSDEQPKSTLVMKEIGAMWKALSQNEKDTWNEKAKADA